MNERVPYNLNMTMIDPDDDKKKEEKTVVAILSNNAEEVSKFLLKKFNIDETEKAHAIRVSLPEAAPFQLKEKWSTLNNDTLKWLNRLVPENSTIEIKIYVSCRYTCSFDQENSKYTVYDGIKQLSHYSTNSTRDSISVDVPFVTNSGKSSYIHLRSKLDAKTLKKTITLSRYFGFNGCKMEIFRMEEDHFPKYSNLNMSENYICRNMIGAFINRRCGFDMKSTLNELNKESGSTDPNVVISGSIVVQAMLSETWTGSDVDIYCKPGFTNSVMNKLEKNAYIRLASWNELKKSDYTKSKSENTFIKSVHEATCCNGQRLQLIETDNIWSAINCFDTEMLMNAYTPTILYTKSVTCENIFAKKMKMLKSNPVRENKYSLRGFLVDTFKKE